MKDVVFIYLGTRVPKYVDASLQLACEYSGLPVTFIGEGALRKRFLHLDINFIELNSFYNPKKFQQVKNNVKLDHFFRAGFWLHTLERLFVLEQFMVSDSRSTIFHAELDQLLFGVDDLINNIEKTKLTGVFFPFHNTNKAVASVFFCNKIDSLRLLIDEASMGGSFANEMELLVRWASKSPEHFFALPTITDVSCKIKNIEKNSSYRTLDYQFLGGVVDAAELGLWVAGRDPRNLALSERPATKFTYPNERAAMPRSYLERLRFHFFSMENHLMVIDKNNGDQIRIYNLHIQAKIHPWLKSNKTHMSQLFQNSNSNNIYFIPGTRLTQIAYAFTVIMQRIRKEKLRYVVVKSTELFRYLVSLIK